MMKHPIYFLLSFSARLGARPLFVLFAVSTCWGQGFGTIVGTVSDPSGAVIAGAGVTVTDPATGVSREKKTNHQGYYVLLSRCT